MREKLKPEKSIGNEIHGKNKGPDYLVAERQGVPMVVARYEIVRESKAAKPPLESFPDFFCSDQYRQHCFEEIRKAWVYQFDHLHVAQALDDKPKDENFRYLKFIRKIGSTLANMHRFFNATHQPPDALKKFLYELGKLNDQYWMPSKTTVSNRILAEQNEWKNLAEAESAVSFANRQDFQGYSQDLLVIILGYLNKPDLPAEDFHQMRRLIRQCANLAQVAAMENLGQGPHWLFAKLDGLSSVLGKKYDKLITKQLPNEDYKKRTIPVEPSLAEDFREVLPYLKKAIGI